MKQQKQVRSRFLKPFLFLIFLYCGGAAQGQTLVLILPRDYHPKPFTHPGLMHTDQDLQRIREMVSKGTEPWKSAFEKFRSDKFSSSNWKPRPAAHVERSLLKNGGKHITELENDACAAYQNAIMWTITQDQAHAQAAVEILNAWSSSLEVFDGTDVELGAGLTAFKLASAAELMRSTYPKWGHADILKCQLMFKNIFYPPIQFFALWAHGNWDLACMKGMMAIAIFNDDHLMFNRTVDFYYRGPGNGSLLHYIINESGQGQESGRDQPHSMLGIGHLAEMCEMGWSQGLDMYSYADNRLLKGFEYAAKYNLGYDVPFEPYVDISGRFPASAISTNGRGNLRSIFEQVYNHYAFRVKTVLPVSYRYTMEAANKLRPEGPGFKADNAGFGTLFFSLQHGN